MHIPGYNKTSKLRQSWILVNIGIQETLFNYIYILFLSTLLVSLINIFLTTPFNFIKKRVNKVTGKLASRICWQQGDVLVGQLFIHQEKNVQVSEDRYSLKTSGQLKRVWFNKDCEYWILVLLLNINILIRRKFEKK